MGTTYRLSQFDRARLRVLRDSVFDYDIIVDDARRDLVRAEEALEIAVARRDDLARQLERAIVAVEAA